MKYNTYQEEKDSGVWIGGKLGKECSSTDSRCPKKQSLTIKVTFHTPSVWKKVDCSHSLHTAVEGILVDRYTHTHTHTHIIRQVWICSRLERK